MAGFVTRFAPSPTGYLHLGHAYAALFAADLARMSGGRFVLRIEDIDATRTRAEYERAIEEDLAWLGVTWEQPVRRQSEHFEDYAKALGRFEAEGLLYPCFCTRREIAAEIIASVGAPQGPEGFHYPGTCRGRSADECADRIGKGQTHAWRLDVQKAIARCPTNLPFNESGDSGCGDSGLIAARGDLFGDVVLARKETPASYHLAVVVDDALQGVTMVTRGNDLYRAAHLQRLLQHLLGLPVPGYRHHALVLDENGQRLAKRDRSQTLRELRRDGVAAADIAKRLGITSR